MIRLLPEMRAVFSAECEDYLSTIAAGLLAIEQDPASIAHLDQVFRAAHSLKGTSRVMGCDDLARTAHGLESLLDRVRQLSLTLGRDQFDALSGVMDGLRRLLAATLDGHETGRLATELLGILEQCMAKPGPAVAQDDAAGRPEAAAPPNGLPPPAPSDVLRVPAARLDALVNQVGELLVTRQRMQQHAERCRELADQIEDAQRHRDGRLDRAWLGPVAVRAAALAHELEEEEARSSTLFERLSAAIHRTRVVPLAAVFDQVPRWVRDIGSATGKSVRAEVAGSDLELDKRIVDGLRDPLLHLVRNAVDHGIESPDVRRAAGKPAEGVVRLAARRDRGGVIITVADDGSGLDGKAIRTIAVARGLVEARQADSMEIEALAQFLLLPGFSTRDTVTEYSGRGVGLDVVASHLAALRGEVAFRSTPGVGCEVSLRVPPSLASTRVLHVESGGLSLGIPSVSVRVCVALTSGLVRQVAGRAAIVVDGRPVALVSLTGLWPGVAPGPGGQVVVLEGGGDPMAVEVDALCGEIEVLEKPLPERLCGLEPFSGVSILGDGRLLLLLEPGALAGRARANWRAKPPAERTAAEQVRERRILLVDDSLTTRVQLRRILEAGGYLVQPAVDGLDAWARLSTQSVDAVVTDVQMPGMDGLALTARIRQTPHLAHLPVVLVTTLASEEDRRRGLDAGASAYISKGSFDQQELLDRLRHLV